MGGAQYNLRHTRRSSLEQMRLIRIAGMALDATAMSGAREGERALCSDHRPTCPNTRKIKQSPIATCVLGYASTLSYHHLECPGKCAKVRQRSGKPRRRAPVKRALAEGPSAWHIYGARTGVGLALTFGAALVHDTPRQPELAGETRSHRL